MLGSAGRGESLLAMDQDNALVFAEGEPDGPEDRWFAALGTHVADILHEAGVPYCAGGVMAKNPAWRGSLATWRDRIADWISRSNPQDLLSVDIFFDLRGVHGDIAPCHDALARGLRSRGRRGWRSPSCWPRRPERPRRRSTGSAGSRPSNGRIDCKKSGLFGIVSTARALAIRHHVAERATPARLAGVKALGLGEADLDALIDAQATFLDLILAQQIRDIADGIPPGNTVAVGRLSRRERDRLRGAFHAVAHLDTLTQDLLFRA